MDRSFVVSLSDVEEVSRHPYVASALSKRESHILPIYVFEDKKPVSEFMKYVIDTYWNPHRSTVQKNLSSTGIQPYLIQKIQITYNDVKQLVDVPVFFKLGEYTMHVSFNEKMERTFKVEHKYIKFKDTVKIYVYQTMRHDGVTVDGFLNTELGGLVALFNEVKEYRLQALRKPPVYAAKTHSRNDIDNIRRIDDNYQRVILGQVDDYGYAKIEKPEVTFDKNANVAYLPEDYNLASHQPRDMYNTHVYIQGLDDRLKQFIHESLGVTSNNRLAGGLLSQYTIEDTRQTLLIILNSIVSDMTKMYEEIYVMIYPDADVDVNIQIRLHLDRDSLVFLKEQGALSEKDANELLLETHGLHYIKKKRLKT